nr:uncharacterized protein At4g22758 [Ipomoea trifida]
MLLCKAKKNPAAGKRLLVSITVLGSAGPIRFVASENDLVAAVIDTALKSYAREGRLPILGSDLNNFVLYCPNAATEALSPWDTIGSLGVRNFVLCKKPAEEKATPTPGNGKQASEARKPSSSIWKTLLNKSLNAKVMSH